MTGTADERGGAARLPRDRDEAGRPRNARARDASGRPLPRTAAAAMGARSADGTPDAVPEEALPPGEALALADRLLAADRPFAAHEVLEASWKAAAAPERDFWRGLAQLAVGLVHLQRGNARGAVALLRRAADRLAPYAEAPRHGVDVTGLRETAQRLADKVEADGNPPPQGAYVRLRRSAG